MLTEGRLNTTPIWRKLRKIIESKNITLALTLYYLPSQYLRLNHRQGDFNFLCLCGLALLLIILWCLYAMWKAKLMSVEMEEKTDKE